MKLPSVTEKLRGSRAAQSLEKLSRVSRRHQFLFQCGLILLYRLVLDFMYLTQLSPIYAYSGFTTDLVWIKYALSWLLVLVCLPLVVGLQGQEERPSSILVTLMNYVYFLPMTSYLGCKGSDLGFFCAVAVYWLVLLAVQLRMPTILVPKLPHRHTSLLFFLVSVGACLFVMGISGIYTGFRLKLNLSDVYGIRAEAAAYDIPGLFAYVLSWMTVIMILAMCVVTVGAYLMGIFEPDIDFIDILFEVASAFGTAGLSTGITQQIGIAGKLLSIVIMYIGRLGPLTIATLWHFSKGERINYPEGNITIG